MSPGGANPGIQSAGNTTWNGAANYNWQLYDATGVAGVGYDLLDVTGTLDVSAASNFSLNLWTLSAIGPSVNGDAVNFSAGVARAWTLVRTTGGVVGFNVNNFKIYDFPNNGTGGFANARNGSPPFTFQVVGNNLVLFFSPALATPAAATQEATVVSASTGQVNGVISPNGPVSANAYFEYGPTTSYGSYSPTNIVRSGLNFNGVDQRISVPQAPTLNFTSAFTLEAWARTTNGVDQYLATKNEDSFFLAIGPSGASPNKAAVALNGVNSTAWVSGTSDVNDGRWHHLAATYDGAALKLYVDGELEGTAPRTGAMATGTSPVSIGSRGTAGYFGGTLAQMRLWGAALSQSTLQDWLNGVLSAAHPNFAQLRACWPMNEESGTVLADASGNDNRALLAGGQTWSSREIPVSAALAGLIPGHVYHYRVVGVNNAGSVAGVDQTFTTLTVLPTVNTLTATAVDSFIATLNGRVNPNGTDTAAWLQYGVDANYGSTTPLLAVGGGNATQAVSVTVSNLFAGTTYHYRLTATNTAGAIVGTDLTFTTPTAPPSAATLAVTALTSTSATLNGSANPNGVQTEVFFEYGLTASYGSNTLSTSIGAGTVAQPISASITGLLPGRTYHYRAVAYFYVSSTYGEDMTFQTPVPSPTIGPSVRQAGGAFQLQFSGVAGVAYRIFGSTNLIDWVVLGPATENPPGAFLFVDSDAPNHAQRFYQLRWP